MTYSLKEKITTIHEYTFEFNLKDICISTFGLTYKNELNSNESIEFDSLIEDLLNEKNYDELVISMLDVYRHYFYKECMCDHSFSNDGQSVVLKLTGNNNDKVIIKVINTITDEGRRKIE